MSETHTSADLISACFAGIENHVDYVCDWCHDEERPGATRPCEACGYSYIEPHNYNPDDFTGVKSWCGCCGNEFISHHGRGGCDDCIRWAMGG